MDEDRSTNSNELTATKATCSPQGTSNGGLWEKVRGLFGQNRDASLRESLEGVIEQHGTENGTSGMRDDARLMMLNLLEFAEMRVDDVMVPRADIISVDEQTTLRDLMACFISAQHSRLPVYRETLDEPVGMVHIKDLMRWISERSRKKAKRSKSPEQQQTQPISNGLSLGTRDMDTKITASSLLRPVLFVPPSMAAGDLLVKMQSTRCHMAIVVDEYGGTDGLVSIEDLVEEIVGDIADEHDNEDDLIRAEADGTYLADARAAIEDVEEVLNVDLLPDEIDEDIDTLGGMVFSMLGRVPVRGELIRHDSGIEFEILGADPRRVKKLRIHTRPKGVEASGDPGIAAE